MAIHSRTAQRARLAGCSVVFFCIPFLIGCTSQDNDTGATAEPPDLDSLRSLPYVGSVEAASGENTGVVYRDPERSQPGLTLYTIQDLSRAELIDEDGRVVSTWHDEHSKRWERAELLPDGSVLVIGIEDGPGAKNQIPDDRRYVAHFDRKGLRLWKHNRYAHHDIESKPDGDFIMLTFKRRRIPGIDATVDVRDDHLTRFHEDGRVLEELSLWDAFAKRPDLTDLLIPRPSHLGVVPWIDLFHANSLDTIQRPELADRHPIFAPGNILICLRHQNLIAVVNWEREDLVWVWGRGELLGPHDARVLDNGNLLVFDNGMGRAFSRVIELDPVTEKIVWEYRGSLPAEFYTLGKGSSQRLGNGNTLIAESDRGRAFEVTQGGETVWEFVCPYETASGRRAAIVRAIRYERSYFEDEVFSGLN